MDKLDYIIKERQLELQGLQAELNEALWGVESPDYEKAARIQPIIFRTEAEIKRLENLRHVMSPALNFPFYISALLTDDKVTVLELWIQINDHWGDVTFRLLEIRKLKSGRAISCMLKFTEAAKRHLYESHTRTELQHIGWKALRGGSVFYYKTLMRSPDQFDAFCQMMSVIALGVLPGLWKDGRQYYQFR